MRPNYLYGAHGIAASDNETKDTAPGSAISYDDYSLQSNGLRRNHYQIKLLANVDQVPEASALISATFPIIARGTGFPVWAFAILPN